MARNRPAEKRPELPEQPLPCPFCGSAPKVTWNGAMTIKCTTEECCQPKTSWWYDVGRCLAQSCRNRLSQEQPSSHPND